MAQPRTYQDTGRDQWFSAAPIVRRTPDDVPDDDTQGGSD